MNYLERRIVIIPLSCLCGRNGTEHWTPSHTSAPIYLKLMQQFALAFVIVQGIRDKITWNDGIRKSAWLLKRERKLVILIHYDTWMQTESKDSEIYSAILTLRKVPLNSNCLKYSIYVFNWVDRKYLEDYKHIARSGWTIMLFASGTCNYASGFFFRAIDTDSKN